MTRGLLVKTFSLTSLMFEDPDKSCSELLKEADFEIGEGVLLERKLSKTFEMETIIDDRMCTHDFILDYTRDFINVLNLTYMCFNDNTRLFTKTPFLQTISYDDLDILYPEMLKSERELDFVRLHKIVFVSGLGFPYHKDQYENGLDGMILIHDEQRDQCLTLTTVTIRKSEDVLSISSVFDMKCLYTLIFGEESSK